MRELGIALIAALVVVSPIWTMAVMLKAGARVEQRFGRYGGGLTAVIVSLAPVALLGPVAVWLVV